MDFRDYQRGAAQSQQAAGPVSPLDSAFPDAERLPRHGVYLFVPVTNQTSRPSAELWFEGERRGNVLTDAIADGYRFHDVFHLSYAVFLGWSPVTRALLHRKRRSNAAVKEHEDGGLAVVVEEGITAFVFAYAAQHGFLADVTRLDQRLLDSIGLLAAPTEARVRSSQDWERAILRGFACFRSLLEHAGGGVTFDADAGILEYVGTTESPSA